MTNETLEARIARLEAVEAIRKLKARYFHACDTKSPRQMRDCFIEGEMLIDYGRVGTFNNRDALLAVFELLGCKEHIVEMHNGPDGQIDILGESRAKGIWSLHYQLINTRDNTLTQLGAFYHDEYTRVDGEWKISATRCEVHSTLVLSLADAGVGVLFAGRQAPAAVDDPASQQ